MYIYILIINNIYVYMSRLELKQTSDGCELFGIESPSLVSSYRDLALALALVLALALAFAFGVASFRHGLFSVSKQHIA